MLRVRGWEVGEQGAGGRPVGREALVQASSLWMAAGFTVRLGCRLLWRQEGGAT